MRRMQRKQLQKTIDRMARLIIRKFDPERIILFGSHARGEAGPDSDVDLLVVMAVPGSKRDKTVEIAAALHEFRIPKEIIVTTPEGTVDCRVLFPESDTDNSAAS